jgi:hypothetical protein
MRSSATNQTKEDKMGNGGGGGGGCYTTIRELPEDEDIVIADCDVTVRLSNNGSARYEFAYSIEGTASCKTHRTFWFYVPNPKNEITGFQASDELGGLETSAEEIESGGGKKTKFVIKYRDEMIPGAKKTLTFTFATFANVIISKQMFRTLIVYVDYVSYTVHCKELKYRIYPPDRYKLYQPRYSHVSLVTDPGGSNSPIRPILLHFVDIHPKSPMPIQIAISSTNRLTKELWKSALFLLVSAEVGAIAGWLTSSQNIYAIVTPVILVGVVGMGYMLTR